MSCRGRFNWTREQVRVTGFLGSGLPREDHGQRWFALHELLQSGQNVADFLETVHALGAASELAGRLRAAQEEDANERGLGAAEVECFAQPMFIFGDAPVGGACAPGEAIVFEAMQGVAYRIFIEIHDRLAVGALVAGVDQRVEGHGVILGGGDFLLNQSAENTGFSGSKAQRLGWRHGDIVPSPARVLPDFAQRCAAQPENAECEEIWNGYPGNCGASFCTSGVSAPSQSGWRMVESKCVVVLNSSYFPALAASSDLAISEATAASSMGLKFFAASKAWFSSVGELMPVISTDTGTFSE